MKIDKNARHWYMVIPYVSYSDISLHVKQFMFKNSSALLEKKNQKGVMSLYLTEECLHFTLRQLRLLDTSYKQVGFLRAHQGNLLPLYNFYQKEWMSLFSTTVPYEL